MRDRGQSVLDASRKWIGTPFHWEASLKGVGVDCKGLLAGAARDCGFPEGETIEATLVGYSRRIKEAELLTGLDRLFDRQACDIAGARPGDVLAFRIKNKVQHLGLYSGDGTRHALIHAYLGQPNHVIEMPLVPGLWLDRLAGVWRWRELPDGD